MSKHVQFTEKTDNELIAFFMDGIEFDEKGFCTDPEQKYSWRPGCYDPLKVEHLQYHKNWSWLMPVVEKIATIEFKDGRYGCTVDFQIANNDGTGWIFWLKNVPGDLNQPQAFLKGDHSLIEKTYFAVVEFIKWYNLQSKP